MLYPEKPIFPIIFNVSDRIKYYMENPPEFDEDSIDKKEGEIFTDLYYPQDPNIIPNRYKVSNKGRVYDTYSNSFIKNIFNNDYEYFALATVNKNYEIDHEKFRANRIVLSSFNPKENMANLHVHHKDNIPINNNLENLEWTTPATNINYAVQDGRFNLVSRQEDLRMDIAGKICEFVKNGGTPEEAGVEYNVANKLVYSILSGDILPFLSVKYNLPKIENKYKVKQVNDKLNPEIAKLIKEDIINGMSEIDLINKYRQPRHVISDIRHGRSYTDIKVDGELPEIQKMRYLSYEEADNIGKLFSEGKSLKEIVEITGFCHKLILDIKRGDKYPEIKEKYNLSDVAIYNAQLDDDTILKEVIPAILSRDYHSDQEVADIFGCSSAQIRDIRLHRRRTYLTEGIEFTKCYAPSTRKRTHVITPLEVLKICKYIEDNPEMPYDDIVKNLSKEIPNITYKLCQDIKLRKNHTKLSSNFKW